MPLLMVGFNRRLAPQVVKIKEQLAAKAEPKSFIMTVNAGEIPADHWTQDPAIGGELIVVDIFGGQGKSGMGGNQFSYVNRGIMPIEPV